MNADTLAALRQKPLTDAQLDAVEERAMGRYPAGGYAERAAWEIAMVAEIRRWRESAAAALAEREGEEIDTKRALYYVNGLVDLHARYERMVDTGRSKGVVEAARCDYENRRTMIVDRLATAMDTARRLREAEAELRALRTPEPAERERIVERERVAEIVMEAMEDAMSNDKAMRHSPWEYAGRICATPQPSVPSAERERPYLWMMECQGCGCEVPPHMAPTHPDRCGKEPRGILAEREGANDGAAG